MPRRKVESSKDVQCKNNALWVVLLPMNKNRQETIEEKPFISVFSDKKEADAMLDRITKYADPDSFIKPYIEEVCLDDNTLPKELIGKYSRCCVNITNGYYDYWREIDSTLIRRPFLDEYIPPCIEYDFRFDRLMLKFNVNLEESDSFDKINQTEKDELNKIIENYIEVGFEEIKDIRNHSKVAITHPRKERLILLDPTYDGAFIFKSLEDKKIWKKLDIYNLFKR